MTVFTKIILFTDTDGRARFREETMPLTEGSPQARLSPLAASSTTPRVIPSEMRLTRIIFRHFGLGWGLRLVTISSTFKVTTTI